MRKATVIILLALILLLAAGLMIGAMRDESATVDETCFLGAGYSYWQGYRYYFDPEHPPLGQLLPAWPLTLMNLKLPPRGSEIMSRQAVSRTAVPWNGMPMPTALLFPQGPDYYYWPLFENRYFSEEFVYGGQNDAERMLFWGRVPQVMLTLLCGTVVFFWARRLAGDTAGLLATTLLLLNPVMLAHGHLIQTDAGLALALPLAVWMITRFLEDGTWRSAVQAGLATGLAFSVKFTSIILGPIVFGLAAVYYWPHRAEVKNIIGSWRGWRGWVTIACVAYVCVLAVYFPNWSPPPLLDPAAAERLRVPGWFQALRPLMIPRDYFKGLSIIVLDAMHGHEGFLNGEWSKLGWWYYFPVAILMKSSVPFLLAVAVSMIVVVRRVREWKFADWGPWIGAGVYLLCAMRSKSDLGVRHVLAVFPMVSVATGCALAQGLEVVSATYRRLACGGVVILVAGMVTTAVVAYPFYICYLNEFAGGSTNGYNHLLDSAFDWGQDAIRLKKFLDERGIKQIYLDYFGTQAAIEYYKIPNTRVNGHQAQQIHAGYLVVSASQLVRPEWQWLRDTRTPMACVAYTTFVYQLH